MLVLSRHVDESIIIGGIITIKVVKIVGDKVKIGIDAPKDISVNRAEIEIAKAESKERDGEKS